MNHEAPAVRARLNAIMAWLLDDGHMTQMAVHQIAQILDDEGIM